MKKPKGFKAFDGLMRKLVKMPPGEMPASMPEQSIGPGICDGCGLEKVELFACDGAPLAGGAICRECREYGQRVLDEFDRKKK